MKDSDLTVYLNIYKLHSIRADTYQSPVVGAAKHKTSSVKRLVLNWKQNSLRPPSPPRRAMGSRTNGSKWGWNRMKVVDCCVCFTRWACQQSLWRSKICRADRRRSGRCWRARSKRQIWMCRSWGHAHFYEAAQRSLKPTAFSSSGITPARSSS